MTPFRSAAGSRAAPAALPALGLVALLVAGCMGTPPGSARPGDSVTIEYSAFDLESGDALRENRTVTFTVGEGESGLGSTVEGSLRGHRANETYTVEVRADPSLDYSERVEVNRSLSPIPTHQTAPRADFAQYVGEPTVGQTFDAYGIYTGKVTNVTNDTVSFQVIAEDGQEDPVPSVGATLVTHVTETALLRRLDPVDGATFTIQPPSPFQPTTPLGLQAGSYRVAGSTDGKLLYDRSASAQTDLVGRELRVVVHVLEVTPAQAPVPTVGNYGARDSPQVNGDPRQVLGSPLPG
jgi:FKBP-type peptidyl-prolyl cis-trans isomerase 2